MNSVLIIDDDRRLRTLISSWVGSVGHRPREAGGTDVLALIEEAPSDIVVCDVGAGAEESVELAARIRDRSPHTAIIMVSALRNVEIAIANLRNDVVDYLLKPFDRGRLLEALSLARDWHAASAGGEELHRVLQDRLRTRRAVVAAALAEAQTTHEDALDGLISMLQLHERDGRGHATRVARLTMALADEIGLNDAEMIELEHSALAHDIGKLETPASILGKAAPLTEAEWKVMREHPQIGHDILKKLPALACTAETVLAHHEAFDGGGYPRGLSGASIPIGARILAIADAYDSMTHPHTQRPPMQPALAIQEIERCSGTQFDPSLAVVLGGVLTDIVAEPA